MKFRVLIDSERCKGCVLCVVACPHGVLRMVRRLNAGGYNYPEAGQPDRCTGCTLCGVVCPEAAVEVEVDEDPSASGPAAREER